jgi:hypothetical protein
LNPGKPPTLNEAQRARLDAMTDADITKAAENDRNNAPLNSDELACMETARTWSGARWDSGNNR